MKLKKPSIRKGCMSCGSKLITWKEKLTRQCDSCAEKALEGFQDMSEGKMKSGFKKVIDARLGTSTNKEAETKAIKDTIHKTVSGHRKKIEKRLRKHKDFKHMSNEEISKEVDKFARL